MMKKTKMLKKIILSIVLMLCVALMPSSIMITRAEESAITDQRNEAKIQLQIFYDDLIRGYNVNDYIYQAMEGCYNKGIAVLGSCAENTIDDYLSEYKTKLSSYVENLTKKVSSDLLLLSDATPISSGKYGQAATVTLYLMNMSSTNIYDIVVTPDVSTDRSKWPFEIQKADNAQFLNGLFASNSMQEAINNQAGLAWTFKVRDDVMQGTYPLDFNVYYTSNGEYKATKVTTYFNATSKDPSDKLISDGTELKSNPRIIVTGFKTEPETIYAGDTFKLFITFQNTSNETTVKNVLFDLVATVSTGSGTNTESYAVFLPTSGSNSIYKNEITPGENYTLEIEMSAKSDLSQKPYALTVNMKYDTNEQLNITDTSDVSIPIKQEAKIETGATEVLPESVAVGEESNIMFDVFNTGKTTLYNVKVTFEDEDVTSGMAYLGNIGAGETKNVDTNVVGAASGDGIVKAIISYEDENGVVSTIEKEINLSVYEEYYEDYTGDFIDDGEWEYTEEESSNSGVRIVFIVIGIVVLIVIIVVAVIFTKKKKNAAKVNNDIDEDDEL